MAEQTPAMTAADVREALLQRWPDSEYLNIAEAPNDPRRQGRKLDLLVVSLWASRGHELDGVEIKVSASDWKRELDNAAKADWWWDHVHRFWIAVPLPLVARVRSELPTGWGLLAVAAEGKPKVVVKPERHEPKPIAWPGLVGLMRASADAGQHALWRAEERGHERGYKAGVEQGKRATSSGHLQRQLDDLRARVQAYRDITGVDLLTDSWRSDATEIGEAVNAITDWRRRPKDVIASTRRQAEAMRRQADQVCALADTLAEVLTPQDDLRLTLVDAGEAST